MPDRKPDTTRRGLKPTSRNTATHAPATARGRDGTRDHRVSAPRAEIASVQVSSDDAFIFPGVAGAV